MQQQEMKLADQLCFSIYNVNRLFAKFYRQALKEYQLTYPQYLVMISLWEKDHVTLHDLGNDLHLDSNTLTPLLKRLESVGWLVRTKPANDKRQLIIDLTTEGKSLQRKVEITLTNCFENITDFSFDQYQQTLHDNQQLFLNLEKIV